MKNRIAYILADVMLGAVLAGPAASAAEQIIAQRSSQTIYVDGRQTPMEAYSINGSNFVRLRDVGKAVGFDVSYDTDNNAVRIDTSAPYTDEAAANVVRLPTDGSKYVPKVGDVLKGFVVCDDRRAWINDVVMG